MSRYKPMGISSLPERIAIVDKRAKVLGLSRSKYIHALVEADIGAGLLDSTTDAKNGKTVVKLRDGVNMVALDKKAEHAEKVSIIVDAMKVLGMAVPQLQARVLTGALRKHAERVLKQRQ